MVKTSERTTDKVCERDSYVESFSATVLGCKAAEDEEHKGLFEVVLDLTAFFPEGGGQKSDTGYIDDAFISDVQERDGEIIHYSNKAFREGSTVAGSIDFEKRYYRMQCHTAEHLLCGLIHNAYGYENVGFHLTDDEVTFDVDGSLSKEEVAEIEERANLAVYDNLEVKISFPAPEELAFLTYRSKLDLTENVRLVEIEGIDICACCAPHVNRTGEIGIIKITSFAPHRGGTRFTMVAGYRAYMDYVCLDNAGRRIMALLSAKRLETADKTEELIAKCNQLLSENVALKREMTEMKRREVLAGLSEKEDGKPVLIFSETFDDVQMRELINSCTEKTDDIVAGFMKTDKGYRYIISRKNQEAEPKLPMLAKDINAALSGRGGGSLQMIMGSVAGSEEDIRKFWER